MVSCRWQASATHFTGRAAIGICRYENSLLRQGQGRQHRKIPDSVGPNYLQNISVANLNHEHAVSNAKYWQTQRVRQKNS